MYFKDVIGQQTIKDRLIGEAREQRIPHALMFCGPQGSGKLPLAIAYARYICCEHPTDHDACGTCQSCKLFDKYIHPDVHFVYPVIKKKGDQLSQDYNNEWRELIPRAPYFNINHWLEAMNAANQQPMIYVKESDEIVRKLSYKSMLGGYKVVIIWLPEKMNTECSNKLLKVLEEPPAKTVFLMASEDPSNILPTILSRTQRMNVPNLEEKDIAENLIQQGLTQEDANSIAHCAAGNYLNALETIHMSKENKLFFNMFVKLMRLAYMRDIKELKNWSESIAAEGREQQKNFLAYCQRMIRENFIYNFHQMEMVYLNPEEKQFSHKFSPFINERNIVGIMNELSEAEQHIERNVNPKMVFFDLVLKTIMLLKQK